MLFVQMMMGRTGLKGGAVKPVLPFFGGGVELSGMVLNRETAKPS